LYIIFPFTDLDGNFITDSVTFTVEDTTNPVITVSPNDFTVEYGYTGQSISWTATDANPDTYTIELLAISDTVTVTINSIDDDDEPPGGVIPFGNFFLIFIGVSVICLIFTKKRQIIREPR